MEINAYHVQMIKNGFLAMVVLALTVHLILAQLAKISAQINAHLLQIPYGMKVNVFASKDLQKLGFNAFVLGLFEGISVINAHINQIQDLYREQIHVNVTKASHK